MQNIMRNYTNEDIKMTTKTIKPLKHLLCACCGSRFVGRQFHNQDTGYGMGDCCVVYAHRNMTDEEFERTYGKAGVHYNVSDPRKPTMSALRLHLKTTTDPDLSGFHFYIEAGRAFDMNDYAEAYKLDANAIDPNDVKTVQAACRALPPGQWLQVWHEIVPNPAPADS